jgi:hypothetical protein
MEAYSATHDVRGLMGELTQSIMVRMLEDPRRFLAEEMGRQLQQQADDRDELGAMPRGSFVLSLHASAGHGREGAGRALRWQRVLSSAPSGRIARYQAERELTEQLRAVIWGGSAGGGEHHELHAEPQAEPPAVPDQAPPAILAERNRIRRGGKGCIQSWVWLPLHPVNCTGIFRSNMSHMRRRIHVPLHPVNCTGIFRSNMSHMRILSLCGQGDVLEMRCA